MGPVEVPIDALWGAQTQRAVDNFPISGRGLELSQIRALARIKAAAAVINAELGVIAADVAVAIVDSSHEIVEGLHDGQFPVDVFQTGSGTSSNMNVNEVIATLATRRLGRYVHPNDEVNASQSSNDVFPTSIHIAAAYAISYDLIPALAHLMSTLDAKATEFDSVVKAGRTHLMDATPVTLGQEFHGYGTQVRYGVERLQASLGRLGELPLGGTAVGTGINAPPGFAARVIEILRRESGLPFAEAHNHFEAQGARDALVEASGQLRTVAVSLFKIANDIRWMGSGPRTGLGELSIPDLQPGSSIMPGKTNPVLCESVRQVCAQVIGADAAIAFAGSQGDFELNVMMPVMAHNLLGSVRILASVSRLFANRCVAELAAHPRTCLSYAEGSAAIATPLAKILGHDEAAEIARLAVWESRPIRDVVVARGHLDRGVFTEEELAEALDVGRMAQP